VDGDALLSAVIANPDDDTVRLVYADWLEEQGDPRAEFIRLQIALARDEPGDQVALELRERDLLDGYRNLWAAPLLGLVTGVQFSRGFPDWVAVDARRLIDDGADLFRAAPISQVWVRRAAGLAEELAACPHLNRLEALDLDDNGLDDGEVAAVLGSPHLGRLWGLNLAGNRVGPDSVRVLATRFADTLRALGLRSALADRGALEALARVDFAGLRHLDLAGNSLRDEIATVLGAPLVCRLVTFDLAMNLLGGTPLTALAAAPALARVRHLILNMNQIDDPGPVASSAHLRLARLDLTDNLLDDGGTGVLARGAGMDAVRTLILRSNYVADRGAGAIAASQALRALAHLDLSNNRVGPNGVARLARRRLCRLDLGNAPDDPDARNAAGDDGAEAIAASPRASELSVLRLDGNRVGDRGAGALAASPHLNNLAFLNVRDNPIGPTGREALARRFGSGVALE
jgi:uncharacterized protein (TIGR02996 family)